MSSIFDRQRLKPSQLRTVANRRYADARYLADSGKNKHANGAMYVGGFVVECLLKAKLIEKYPWLERHIDAAKLSITEREIFYLCYRSHDLERIIELLPELSQNQTIVSG